MGLERSFFFLEDKRGFLDSLAEFLVCWSIGSLVFWAAVVDYPAGTAAAEVWVRGGPADVVFFGADGAPPFEVVGYVEWNSTVVFVRLGSMYGIGISAGCRAFACCPIGVASGMVSRRVLRTIESVSRIQNAEID